MRQVQRRSSGLGWGEPPNWLVQYQQMQETIRRNHQLALNNMHQQQNQIQQSAPPLNPPQMSDPVETPEAGSDDMTNWLIAGIAVAAYFVFIKKKK